MFGSGALVFWLDKYSPPPLMFFYFSAGAGRTGTFIALSNILERVKAEGLLDVFQTVKSLRMQRPHMVQTVVGVKRENIKSAAVAKREMKKKKNRKRELWAFLERTVDSLSFPLCLFLQEQYDFCYRVVQDFVDIFSDYANFK